MAAAVWCKPNGQAPSSGKALCVFCIGHASRAKQSAQPAHWSVIFFRPTESAVGIGLKWCWRERIEKILKAEQAAKAAYKLIAPGRHHHPLNLLNLLNLTTDLYLSTNVSISPCTEILRLRLRMTRSAGG